MQECATAKLLDRSSGNDKQVINIGLAIVGPNYIHKSNIEVSACFFNFS